MGDDLLRRCLVFIAGNGEVMALRLKRGQQFRDAVVRVGIIAVMGIVIGHKELPHTEHGLFGLLSFRQGALNEFIHAVTHQPRVLLDRMRRKTASLQRVIASIAQVVNRIEQRAV